MSGFVSSSVLRLFPSVGSASFLLGIALIAVFFGRSRRASRLLALALAMEASRLLATVLTSASAEPEIKLLWDAIRWPLTLAAGSAYVAFAYSYAEPEAKRLPPVARTLIIVPFAITAVAAALTLLGQESLLYKDIDRIGLPFSEFRYGPSILAKGFSAYGYALSCVACAVAAWKAFSKGMDSRAGVFLILGGLSLRVIAEAAAAALRVPFGSVWSPPLWLAASGTVVAYGLFDERFRGSLGKARGAVMDTLLDPVFVLGGDEVVVDCNAAARTLLGSRSDSPIGQSAMDLFADWPSGVAAALSFPEAETELDLPDRDGVPRRSYRITVASNAAKDRSAGWKLLVFNDITGQKSDARDMAATNEELEFWVRQRTAALRQEVAQRTSAEERLRDLNEEMAKTQREILWTLSEVVESRSRETAYHVVRVGEYARILAQGYGLPSEEVEIVTTAAPMHDVGKIAIPDSILSKPGALTQEEREVMKRHTVVGKEVLGSSHRPLLRAASVIAFEHHERWDGKGYPLGKSGTDISLSGRIVSVCDVFDALYNKRVYKDAWPLEKVLELFRAESGLAFEPRLVDILFERLDEVLDVSSRFADLPTVPDL
jgi:HD-GYP domain-containing protein (c-di-GMP phosphodiesterase class II)